MTCLRKRKTVTKLIQERFWNHFLQIGPLFDNQEPGLGWWTGPEVRAKGTHWSWRCEGLRRGGLFTKHDARELSSQYWRWSTKGPSGLNNVIQTTPLLIEYNTQDLGCWIWSNLTIIGRRMDGSEFFDVQELFLNFILYTMLEQYFWTRYQNNFEHCKNKMTSKNCPQVGKCWQS